MRARARMLWRAALRTTMSVAPVRQRVRDLCLAGRVPKKLWNRLPIMEDAFTVDGPAGAQFRYRTAPGDAIGQALYFRGIHGWETATIRTLCALAARARVFVDIGANTGVYSLLACTVNPEIRVVAYEPVPRVFERLRDNLALNQLESRCQAKNLAISDHVGRARLHVPDTSLPSSASLAQAGFRNLRGQLIDVAVTTVDHDMGKNDQAGNLELFEPVDLVKIDVEGFEDRVLAGMTRILTKDRPIVICECNPDGPYAAVERALEAMDYRFFHVRDSGLEPRKSIVPDPDERFRNYACVPAEDREALEPMTRQRS